MTASTTVAGEQPAWVRALLAKYSSGVAHAFLLHFNTADYVTPGRTLRPYLATLLARREIIAFYDRAEGIAFATASMREKALALLGAGQAASVGQADPMLAALASLGQAGAGENLPRAPGAALSLLERLLLSDTPVAVILDYAETLVPAADVATMSEADRTNLITVQRWGRDARIAGRGNAVFLIASNLADVHASVRAASSKYEAIELPLPDHAARLSFIESYRRQLAAGEEPVREGFRWELSPSRLASVTAGLSLIHLEDVFLRATQEGALTQELVTERKRDIIAGEFGEVLEVLEPRFGWERIGGMEHIKRFFDQSVIAPLREGRTGRVPMGVLLTGPAGTGKTAVAEAVAWEAGINFVVLNLARILGSYVGLSERNLEKALRAIRSLAPCGVLIDEIDQAVSRGSSGDSGVGNRIFKRLLEFMSDTGNRGKVLFLAATNRPDLLDAALRRPGRFDKKVPFLVPDAEERAAIFMVMARAHGLGGALAVPPACIERTDGWTGAEIEAAVVKAVEVVEDEGLSIPEALTRATSVLAPSTADIEFMTGLALRECNDLDLLPPRYRAMVQDRTALEQRVEELAAKTRSRGARQL
jgi:SpoVK/Ycf46/Vps4 family AAA+-type ATPase